MTQTTIQHLVQRVESIEEFKHTEGAHSGRAIMNMPYWIYIGDAWWFDFIKAGMDVPVLLGHIESGNVYRLISVSEK